MNAKSDNRRAIWMRDYERLVVARFPSFVGRIDWDTATFFYRSGYTPQDAANKTFLGNQRRSETWAK